MAVTVTAVVPTVGASPLLGECLRALRAQRLGREGDDGAGGGLEIVLVRQGAAGAEDLSGGPVRGAPAAPEPGLRRRHQPRDRGGPGTVRGDGERRRGGPTGLAAGAGRGARRDAGRGGGPGGQPAAEATGRGDDRFAGGATDPGAAAPGERVDGWGLGWNRAAQAVQLGRGDAPPAPGEPPREVFGVSATAAVYRRSALLEVARASRPAPGPSGGGSDGEGPEVFDSRLESYYEDADLACRLRAAGYTALSVPAARALHAGSLTGGRLGARRWRLLYGNRYAVAAHRLGRGLWLRLPRMAARDVADLGRALARGELRKAVGIAGGWARAARLLPAYAHRGAPMEGSP